VNRAERGTEQFLPAETGNQVRGRQLAVQHPGDRFGIDPAPSSLLHGQHPAMAGG
jgi:hypothetical protein